MLGLSTNLLAMVVLATLSAGGLAYAFLYGRISSVARGERRLDEVKALRVVANPASRLNDPTKRRKSIQETLKELDERQKAKTRESTSPSLAMRMQQAGLSWSKQKFIVVSLAMGLFGALAGLLGGLPACAIAIFALTCALAAPRWLVNFLRKRRLKKFASEFPNAIDVIVRGVKAGLPLGDCLRIISREAKEPVRSEFKSINEAQGLGLGTSDAVKRLAENIPLPETKFFVIVITIQQQAGGNLAEALGNLSKMLRERKKMKDKINAMSGEAKASAGIIGILPFIVMVLVYFASPGYINLLFTEPLGNVILGFSGVWMVLGVLSMKKMINFDY